MELATIIKKLEKEDKIEITWLDAINHHGWKKGKSFSDDIVNDVSICKTIGYFFGETDKILLVFQCKTCRGDNDNAFVNNVFSIPKGCIEDIKIIK